MTFFRRDSPPTPESSVAHRAPVSTSPSPVRGTAGSTLAVGLIVKGDVTGASALLVEGTLEGNVRLESTVTVGAGGEIRGDVEAHNVRITGKITGNVKARDVVEIAPSGILEGNLAASRVVIAEGAFLKGKVEMKGRRGGAEPPPATS